MKTTDRRAIPAWYCSEELMKKNHPTLRRDFAKAVSRTTQEHKRFRKAMADADLDLLQLATEGFEGVTNAAAWLIQPALGLGGAVPIFHAQTNKGKAEVVALIHRVDHGVY